jgi:YidC/Oxa1 family membrane protein insertase
MECSNGMTNLFHLLLLDPLIKTLLFLYETIAFQDFGVAIILLTVFVRFVLYPLFYRSIKQQHALRKIQPHIEAIQARHKNNREEQGKALMALYKEHGVNPLASLGLVFLQLPILIALYQVFLNPPSQINQSFLGFISLHERSILLVALAAFLQYFLGIMSIGKASSLADDNPAAKTARTMVFMGPVITVAVLWSLPAGVGLYWATTTLFSIAQQWHVERRLSHGIH